MKTRTSYPTDISDDEWAFVVPYLILLPEDAGQRTSSLREVFNGLRWIVRAGAPWRMMPNDLSPWWVVYQRSFAWTTRFRRLARDYERLATTLAGLHLVVFACLMLHQWTAFSSP
jgi:transposase